VIFQKRRSNSIPVLQKPPVLGFETTKEDLPLTVVYTTVDSTLVALRYVAELAAQLGAQIRILMIQAVPYSLPIDRPQVDPDFRVRQFLTRSESASIDTQIDVRLCRDFSTCLLEALPPPSLVLIGAHRRFWFARESGWGKTLKRAGHHVIFAPGNRGESKTFRNCLNRARSIPFQTIIDKDVSRLAPLTGAGQQISQSVPDFLIRLLYRLIRRK
jgi:hypothetical protein